MVVWLFGCLAVWMFGCVSLSFCFLGKYCKKLGLCNENVLFVDTKAFRVCILLLKNQLLGLIRLGDCDYSKINCYIKNFGGFWACLVLVFQNCF